MRRCAAAWGIALVAAAPAVTAETPSVTVRFRGEVEAQWRIEPRVRELRVARGEVFETLVSVRNASARAVVAMVVVEVRPAQAAGALIHLGCGPTFTLVLEPGASVWVPASYFVADNAPPEARAFEIAYAVYSFEPHGAEPLQVGRRIYAERCATCHGARGRGDGPVARLLAGGVADLAPALARKDDAGLLRAIASGVGPMPAFAPALSGAEQQALVGYLRELARAAP